MIDLATLRTLDYPAFVKVFDETDFSNWTNYARALVSPILDAMPIGYVVGQNPRYIKEKTDGLEWRFESEKWRVNRLGRRVNEGSRGWTGGNTLSAVVTFPHSRKTAHRPEIVKALFGFLHSGAELVPAKAAPARKVESDAVTVEQTAPAPTPKRVRKPKAPPAPTREELAAQRAAVLPDTEAELIDVVWDVARNYDAAIIHGDAAGVAAELDRFDAVVFKLNGNTFFGCNADDTRPMRRMTRATAAEPGAAPLWGQTGEFLVSAEGIRARVVYDGLAHLGCSGSVHFEFNIIDLHRPFPSETGYRSHFTGSGAGMTVVERAQAEFVRLIADEGLKHLDAWHLDFVAKQQQEKAAFQPGGYLADLEPLPAIAAPIKAAKAKKKATVAKKAAAPKVAKKTVKVRSILSVSWRNGSMPAPADVETLADGRTLWACCVLDRADEDQIRTDHAPKVALGSGWASCWTAITPPPKRWSGERKAQMRRRNLRARLDKKVPLLADLLERQEITRRPHYFDAAAIDAGEDNKPALTPAPDRAARLVRQPRPEGRFEQLTLGLPAPSSPAPAAIAAGRTATERATYRAKRYCELMARPFVPAPQRVRMAPAAGSGPALMRAGAATPHTTLPM